MSFSSLARVCRMSATNEKTHSSVATFMPLSSRSSLSTCADSPTSAPEQKFVGQLEELLGDESMLPEELGLLYSYRHSISCEDKLKAIGTDANLKMFLENQKGFVFYDNQVQLIQTNQKVRSSTAGDDDDFDDFVSATSDDLIVDHSCTDDLSAADAVTCVYSVLMLLNLRTACSSSNDDTSTVRYSTCCRSEFPAPVAKARWSTKDVSSPASAADSWRQPAPTPLPASAEGSWTVQQRRRETADTPDEDATVLRSARSILNKLTVEKFDSLFEQLVTCGIEHPRHISMLMREVFEKATTQHHFIPMYADLCGKLEKDPRIASIVEGADQLHNFRRILLNQCQYVFEQLLEPPAVDSSMDDEVVLCRKQRALGNMKLIGQLLVNGMLSSDMFVECCDVLLEKHQNCPEALESMVALLMVAGPKFDYQGWQYYQRLEKVLLRMRCLTKDKLVPPRIRFLLRDVLDARAAGWPNSRSVDRTPAKLEDVRNAPAAVPKQTEAQDLNSLREQKAPVKETAAKPKAEALQKETFNVVAFRRTIASVFTDLASDKSIPAAVQRVRLEQVPASKQAEQFMDMITRTVEERRGAVRRCELAFIAGLAAAEVSAFDRKECLAGIEIFFKDVYPELCNEVHRLPAIMKSEFMPTVANVFPLGELNKVVPAGMRK